MILPFAVVLVALNDNYDHLRQAIDEAVATSSGSIAMMARLQSIYLFVYRCHVGYL